MPARLRRSRDQGEEQARSRGDMTHAGDGVAFDQARGSLSVLDGIGSTAEWDDALHQRQAVLACDPSEGGLQELLRERPVAARCDRETIVGAFIQHHRTTRRKNAG